MAGPRADRRRRLLIDVGAALLVAAVASLAVDRLVASRIAREAERDLALLASLRVSALEKYLESARSAVSLWGSHGPLREALLDLSAAWRAAGDARGASLRNAYLGENPYPANQRHLLEEAEDGSVYSRVHRAMHPSARRFLEITGYRDVLLIDADGTVLYSYRKEGEFGTSLLDGPWHESALAEAFRAVRDSAESRRVVFVDFSPYAPAAGLPAAFVAGPVSGEDGTLLGALAVQLAADDIDAITRFSQGVDATGQVYAVGLDGLMRSDSRFSAEPTILRVRVDTEPVRRALQGEVGTMEARDYRGEPVLSAYQPLEFGRVRWAVVAEIGRPR